MSEDKAKGTWDQVKGRAKQAWGGATGDEDAKASGEWDETKGKGREKWGEAKEWVEEQMEDQDAEDKDRSG